MTTRARWKDTKIILVMVPILVGVFLWSLKTNDVVHPVGIDIPSEGCTPSGPAQYFLPSIMNIPYPYFEGSWEVEPNNTGEQANGFMISGKSYFGYPNDRNDLFTIYVPSGGHISAQLDNNTGTGVQLSLFYQSLNNLVVFDHDLPFQLGYQGQPGLYYIFVYTADGYNVDTPYELTITYPTSNKINDFFPSNLVGEKIPRSTTAWMGYRFEDGIHGWGTSEGDFKLAELSVSRQQKCTGEQSLQLYTQITNTGSEILRHTEATAYFNNAVPPEGSTSPGPYNLDGETFSCYVYLPENWSPSDNPTIDIQLFAKDIDYRNQWGQDVLVTNSQVNRWLKLEMVIDKEHAEEGFKVGEVNTIGLRIDVLDDEPIDIIDYIYIDECTISN